MVIINNSVDAAAFAPDENARLTLRQELNVGQAFVWLSVGRLAPAKNHAALIRAFGRVHQEKPDTRLYIAGDGALRRELQALISELGLGAVVTLLGNWTDMPRLYNAADAFVLTSLWEGTPNVLLEAAATCLPLVATPAGDNPVIIQHGASGYIVPEPTEVAIADYMLRVTNLPASERSQMGQTARLRIRDTYSPEGVQQEWEQLLQ